MMLDLYHAQIGEGNLVDLVRRAGAAIGEIQVADVPGRCEPGTGEIHYPAVAKALAGDGYTGPSAWRHGRRRQRAASRRSAPHSPSDPLSRGPHLRARVVHGRAGRQRDSVHSRTRRPDNCGQ